MGNVEEDGVLFHRVVFHLHRDRARRVAHDLLQCDLRIVSGLFLRLLVFRELGAPFPLRQIVSGGTL